MLRHLLLSIVLGFTLAAAGGGCRSCSSCHDYDSPVADCGTCGCQRAGSVSNCGACSPCDCQTPCNCPGGACGPTDGAHGGCNCGNHGGEVSGPVYQNGPIVPDVEVGYGDE